jgi:hypothetical protein
VRGSATEFARSAIHSSLSVEAAPSNRSTSPLRQAYDGGRGYGGRQNHRAGGDHRAAPFRCQEREPGEALSVPAAFTYTDPPGRSERRFTWHVGRDRSVPRKSEAPRLPLRIGRLRRKAWTASRSRLESRLRPRRSTSSPRWTLAGTIFPSFGAFARLLDTLLVLRRETLYASASARSENRYPTPRTVWMKRPALPSLSRSLFTCVSTVRDDTPGSSSHTSLSSVERV